MIKISRKTQYLPLKKIKLKKAFEKQSQFF